MLGPGLVVEKFTIKRVHDGQRITAKHVLVLSQYSGRSTGKL